ncbi:MAG: ribonuclease HII [Clostridia bacterium]|nr:ribonuclease HII [Clostridia bacterium]
MKRPDAEELQRFERELAAGGCRIIAGVDEAGRGPLAGPVVACCAVFDAERPYPDAYDSKQLSEKAREKLYDEIMAAAISVGIGFADSERIDEINILEATKEAMLAAVKEASVKLGRSPDAVLVDHVSIPGLPAGTVQRSVTHGDALSVSIAAASVIAKVTRDRLMTDLDAKYPGYGFAKHKGYGTKAHYDAIRELGASPIHRRSFLKKMH